MLRVVVSPHPPLFLPGAGGAADPLAELRADAVDAIRSQIHSGPEVVHLVGAGGRSWPGSPLPLSLVVGDHLLDLAGWAGERRYHALPEQPSVEEVANSVVVLLGDGEARRNGHAPGDLDGRAEGLDATIEKALAGGDGAPLAALDAGLGDELMAVGIDALALLGGWGQALGVTSARMVRADAPYGVAYWVAIWQLGS